MTQFVLPSRLYDFIKYLVLIVMPGISTLYIVLANAWGWDNMTNVSVTLTAITTFLGGFVGISSRNYNNTDRYVGETYLVPTDEGWKRVFNFDADEIDPNRKEISFKVVDSQAA